MGDRGEGFGDQQCWPAGQGAGGASEPTPLVHQAGASMQAGRGAGREAGVKSVG